MDATAEQLRASDDRWWRLVPVVAGAVFVVLAVHAAMLETPTIDEYAHVPAGLAYLDQGRLDLYAENPPLMKVLMALPLKGRAVVPPEEAGEAPWRYGDRFEAANRERYLGLFTLARLPVVLAGLLTGVVLFVWSRRLFGVRAAAVVTTVFYLSPTVLAHAHLATTDVGSMLTVFLTAFLLWRAARRPSWWRLALAGAAWGAALLVKFTAVLMLPAVCLVPVLVDPPRWRRALAQGGAMLAAALVVVNLGMGFEGSLRPIGESGYVSRLMSTVQRLAPPWLPVPLPAAWVAGFDAQADDTETGTGGGYLLGRWSREGWWYYHLVALAVKTPPPLLAMVLICPWFVRRQSFERGDLAALLVPLACLGIPLLLLNRLDIGIRYLLPLFPFLLVLVAALWRRPESRRARPLAAGLIAYYLLNAALTHPGYLSYFSPLVGGAPNGHRILADSNLDWGQDLYRVEPALDALGHRGKVWLLYFGHVPPSVYGIDYELVPAHPVEGTVVASLHYLLGGTYQATDPRGRKVAIPRHHLDWLRGHEPVLRLGSIWVFDVKTKAGDDPGRMRGDDRLPRSSQGNGEQR
jgi:4-amino-4-deoxy-L-arabinose transferase-like glycosyltransferase